MCLSVHPDEIKKDGINIFGGYTKGTLGTNRRRKYKFLNCCLLLFEEFLL